ncbi:MAG: T9SS type A sorting domain-containing protein [Bacteroidota bacterium]
MTKEIYQLAILMRNALLPVRSLSSLCYCLLIAAPLAAQINITENRLTNELDQRMKEVLYETNLDIDGTLSPLIQTTGPNQSWNFADLNYVDSTILFEELTEVNMNDPYINDPNLAGASLRWYQIVPPATGAVLQDTVFRYLYGNLVAGNWTYNGGVTIADIDFDGEVDTFLQWFDPPSLQVRFPVTENSAWHDSTTFNQNFMGMPFQSATELDSNWVVGWGSLQTPAGTTEVLRVNNKVVNQAFGSPLVDIGNSIEFQSADGAISAAIVIEDGRAFHRVRTNVGMATSTRQPPRLRFRLLPNFPNPVAEQTRFQFELQDAGRVELNLLDNQGRTVAEIWERETPAGVQNILWNNPGLPAGLYWLRMRMGQQVLQQAVIIGL